MSGLVFIQSREFIAPVRSYQRGKIWIDFSYILMKLIVFLNNQVGIELVVFLRSLLIVSDISSTRAPQFQFVIHNLNLQEQ